MFIFVAIEAVALFFFSFFFFLGSSQDLLLWPANKEVCGCDYLLPCEIQVEKLESECCVIVSMHIYIMRMNYGIDYKS